MDTFEKAANLLYARATGPNLAKTFRYQTAVEEKKSSDTQKLSQEIRSSVRSLSSVPSPIQQYASELRLHEMQSICKLFRGRISAIVADVFGCSAQVWLKKTIHESQEKLDTILGSRHTEDELNLRLARFWGTLDFLCHARLRAHDRDFSEEKYKQLKTCMEIHVGTTLGMTFADDRTINPAYTHLLDRSLNYERSLQGIHNS